MITWTTILRQQTWMKKRKRRLQKKRRIPSWVNLSRKEHWVRSCDLYHLADRESWCNQMGSSRCNISCQRDNSTRKTNQMAFLEVKHQVKYKVCSNNFINSKIARQQINRSKTSLLPNITSKIISQIWDPPCNSSSIVIRNLSNNKALQVWCSRQECSAVDSRVRVRRQCHRSHFHSNHRITTTDTNDLNT